LSNLVLVSKSDWSITFDPKEEDLLLDNRLLQLWALFFSKGCSNSQEAKELLKDVCDTSINVTLAKVPFDQLQSLQYEC
jgi:hypothetical protein